MMTIVITMAGLGSRFQKAGYKVPKFMIEAKGKTLFEWSMDSLKDIYDEAETHTIFIVRKECNAREFIKNTCVKLGINHTDILEIDYLTDGQATTALLASKLWNKKSELLIYNIDTYVEPYSMKYQDISGDGYIPCFNAPGDHWSFVRLDDAGNAVEVREKTRISDHCTIGAYYFKTCELYENLYRQYYSDESHLEHGERYVAPLYNFLIQKGGKVNISDIPEKRVHVLGTPEELEVFLKD